MLTVVETPTFMRCGADLWADDERAEFFVWLANHPEAGDVIPGTGGLRKVRWSRSGMGRRGGARVIYLLRRDDGLIYLVIGYSKAKFDNLPASVLDRLRRELLDG